MTIEHLGSVATEEDLEEFQHMVHELMRRDSSLSELEATDLLWGNGDYIQNAADLKLLT